MSQFSLTPSLEYKLHSMPRGIDYDRPIKHSCQIPHKALVIDLNGDCFLCICDGWLPIPVGKIQDFSSLEDIWKCSSAQVLQKDVKDKKFSWCAVEHCGIIDRDLNIDDYQILLNIDESCNLACPSCRQSQILHTSGEVFQHKVNQTNHFIKLLENFHKPVKLTLSGNGDPLASLIIRPLITNFQPLPQHKIKMHTNGLLLKKLLPKSKMLPSISEYSVSIDAGSDVVYADVRRPGRWENLIDNLNFLQCIAKEHNSSVVLNFCYQRANFRDLKNFIDLCELYDFYGSITPVDNWGTWNDFDKENILNPAHKLYNESNLVLQECIESNNGRITFHPLLTNRLR